MFLPATIDWWWETGPVISRNVKISALQLTWNRPMGLHKFPLQGTLIASAKVFWAVVLDLFKVAYVLEVKLPQVVHCTQADIVATEDIHSFKSWKQFSWMIL